MDEVNNEDMRTIAARNLRSFVSRHVPEGPDRTSALLCVDALSSTPAAPGIDLHAKGNDARVDDDSFAAAIRSCRSHIGACRPDDDEPEEQWLWDKLTTLIDASPKGGSTDETIDLLPELRDVEDYFKDVDPNPIHLATVRQAISVIADFPNGGGNVVRGVTVERLEDMSVRGRLKLYAEEDGDMCLMVIENDGASAGIEFCATGGRSPRTLEAVRALSRAMEQDNAERPINRATSAEVGA